MSSVFSSLFKCVIEGLILYFLFISPIKVTSDIIKGSNGYAQSALIVFGQIAATFAAFILGGIWGFFNSRLKISVDFKNKIYETNNTCCFFKNKTHRTSDPELEVEIFIKIKYKSIFKNKALLKYIQNRKLSFYITKNNSLSLNSLDSEIQNLDTLNGFDILLSDLLTEHFNNSNEFIIPKTLTSKITIDTEAVLPIEKGERIYCKIMEINKVDRLFNKIQDFIISILFINENISNHDLNLRIK